jgi:hypothetical protein
MYREDLLSIENHNLRNDIEKFIYTNELYLCISDGNINSCFSYLYHMNPYYSSRIFMNDKKSISFDLGLYEMIILMVAINNTSELQHIAGLMKSSFCYEEIYSTFKF